MACRFFFSFEFDDRTMSFVGQSLTDHEIAVIRALGKVRGM